MTARPHHVYPTAFLEGAAVIIVEIAGARAMAPYFGTSLQVWTATITVTLLFLALGYGLGGLLARTQNPWTLPALFGIAGIWLALYPLLRTPIFDLAANMGVAFGSLFSAILLFGVPLMMLGAVSPVLIAEIDRRHPGAGSAAGRLFFTNTIGGLVGGWATAFLIIPHASLRVSLITTGVALLAMALVWAIINRTGAVPVLAALLIGATAVLIFHRPPRTYKDKRDISYTVTHSKQSGIGLLQVLDYESSRFLLINGVIQGAMDRGTQRATPADDYIHMLHVLSYSHHPEAKTALQLGLGAGLLPKELANRGLKVTAVEIEPQMAELARKYFALPPDVDVRIADARAFLRHDTSKYDLVFLDTFASESTAWHMLTAEAMRDIRARLDTGGRLVINNVAYAGGTNPGLSRLEATVRSAFPEVKIYAGRATADDPEELVNVTLVAGEALAAKMVTPPTEPDMQLLSRFLANERSATPSEALTMTDDRSDLDYVESALRVRWRTLIWESLGSNLLWD